jgi:hypothetical protein
MKLFVKPCDKGQNNYMKLKILYIWKPITRVDEFHYKIKSSARNKIVILYWKGHKYSTLGRRKKL